VVVDEVIGQWITLAGPPPELESWLAAFAAVPPVRYLEAPPVRQLERCPAERASSPTT
jgi:phosphatidylglycerophosphatase A